MRAGPMLTIGILASTVIAIGGEAQRGRRPERPPIPAVAAWPLEPMGASACEPPFPGSSCAPGPGAHQCRAIESARSRDGSVSVELVEDGNPMDLVAVHLVVRVGDRAFRDEHIAERGVGCGPFEMFSASYGVDSLRVADVLHGPAPEIILLGRSARGPELFLCTTDVLPPRCVRGDVTATPRFRHPDLVIAGPERYRFTIDPPAP